MKRSTLGELAKSLGGELHGDPDVVVTGVGPLNAAGPDQVSFLANHRYLSSLKNTAAAGVIVSRDLQAEGLNLIRVDDPYMGFAQSMEFFYSEPFDAQGISNEASVHPDARIGKEPSIYPFAVVCSDAEIGNRVTLMSGSFVGQGVKVGDGTTIHPNVVLEKDVTVGRNVIIHAGTVVGSDGFGFAGSKDGYKKIIHAGSVRVEDDVEIGAGCTIDRGVMGDTVIGSGSKLDNLIQIGHNVTIGANCILVAQVGVAGSSELEEFVTMAGQSGVAGHLKVGKGSVVMGKASVFKDLAPGSVVAGTPAIEAGQWRKASAVFNRLDDLRKKVARLEKELSLKNGGEKEEESS